MKKFTLVPQTCKTSAIWFLSAEWASSFWKFTVCMWQKTNAQMKHKSIADSLALFFQNAASHCFSKDTPCNTNKSLLTTDAFALWTACTKWWLYENFILIPISVYFSYCKMDHPVLGGGFSRTYDPHFLLFKCHVHTWNLLHSQYSII